MPPEKIAPLLLSRRSWRESVRVEMEIGSNRANEPLELQCWFKTAAYQNLTDGKGERSTDDGDKGREEDLHKT